MSQSRTAVLWAAVVTLALAAYFVVSTVTMDTLPDVVLVGGAAVVALALAAAYFRSEGVSAALSADVRSVLWSIAGGVLAFWAAPLLMLSQRATDAPSGADSLFMMATASGLAVAVAAWLLPAEKTSPTVVSGAVAACAGSAGLLASWETPSSFSPFAKFPLRESLMLLAAVLFAAGLAALAVAIRRVGQRPATLLALTGAAGAGLATALPFIPGVVGGGVSVLVASLYLGCAVAVLAVALGECGGVGGLGRASAGMLAAPVAVMLYAATERFTGAHGPDPVVWPGAVAGIAVLFAGIAAIWLGEAGGQHAAVSWRNTTLPLGVAGLACVLGAAQLMTPALDAVAQGGIEGPFRASWQMIGAEAASGWLVVSAPVLVLSATWSAIVVRARLRVWVSALVAAVVCLVALLPLANTTLHTWNRWVPADVQQTYGTEYSRLVTSAHLDLVRVGAVLTTLLAIVVLGGWAWRLSQNSEGSSR